MRWLIVVRLLLLVAMLGLAVAWLSGTIDDVSGPLLLVCPLVILTYRAELRRMKGKVREGDMPYRVDSRFIGKWRSKQIANR